MNKMVCTQCGVVCLPERITPGSVVTEIVLFICGILPGLIYCIWRLAGQYNGCPACKSKNIIPITSPMAQPFLERLQAMKASQPVSTASSTDKACPYCKATVPISQNTCNCGYTWPSK